MSLAAKAAGFNMMCERKSPGAELRSPRRCTSPLASESSSGELPVLSSSSSSSSTSSVSYSSKMPNEGTCAISMDAEDKVQNVPKTKAMSLVGCPRCFMYVMLSEEDPKCPKCKSTVFLEFFTDENFKTDN